MRAIIRDDHDKMLNNVLLQIYILNYVLCVVSKPNFLLIIVDDLRPALGCYKDNLAYTPNIDKLADKNFIFHRAYAQQSLCAPSRNSFLTSRRPDTLLLYDFYSYWRNSLNKNFSTLPQYLKENGGYVTKSFGKIFHPGISSNYSDDSPYSWSEIPFHPRTNKVKNSPVCYDDTTNSSKPTANIVCPVNVSATPGTTLPDIEILNAAKKFLIHHHREKPFFLAVGFEKPHIPLKYPSQYKSYHPLKKFKDIKNYYWPKNINNIAYNPWIDLRKRDDIKSLNLNFPWETIPQYYAKKIIQSYYSAVTYIDHLIGILLKQLKILKLDTNTIIILTSDHGWSLGEHGLWAKYSNFEVALKVPLIVSLPHLYRSTINNTNIDKHNLIKQNATIHINSIVELVDLFPSIAELANIPIPICPTIDNEHLSYENNSIFNPCSEGISFIPTMAAITTTNIMWKRAAFSQYPRPSLIPILKPNSDEPRLNDIKFMGYTIRTKRFRYTAWLTFNQSKKKSNWNEIIAEELYDHHFDPIEMSNQQDNSNYLKKKKRLMRLLKDGWRKALPQ